MNIINVLLEREKLFPYSALEVNSVFVDVIKPHLRLYCLSREDGFTEPRLKQTFLNPDCEIA